jgi:serine/threonine-protein kinase
MEGQKVGKYLIVAKIGSGAMGDVYRAHDAKLNRDVAVKTMAELYASDDQLVQRFQREAQSAAALNHPNVVTVFDFGSEQGKFYLAMELLDGADLKELIASRSLNDLWDKLDVMEQIAEGLAYAHKQGVVHRDLKPANIRVLPNGRVKIMDFGLARIGSSDMTRAGMVMGTPNYMSPEQVRGTKADARSDIFSLGAVFYELLSGKKAFNADSMHTILYKVLEEEPEPVRTYVPGTSRSVRGLHRALPGQGSGQPLPGRGRDA